MSSYSLSDKLHAEFNIVGGHGNMVLPIGTIIVLFLLAAIFNVIDSYVYLLFIAGSIFLGGLLNKTNNKHPKVCFLMLLSLVTYLTVFIGLRDFGVGTDTMVYVDSYWFNSANVNSLKDFYGFDYVSKAYLMLGVIGHLFSDDHQTMLVMTALTINFFTFLAIYIFNYRNLKVNWVIFILFWQLNCMNETMNVMRQDCAESLMLLTFVLALKQRWIWMILAAFIGFQFHSTSLILILLVGYYFLDRYFGRLKRNWLTILGLTLLVIFIIGVFKYSSMLINAGYLNDHFDVYTDNQTFSGINLFGPSYLLMTLVYFYIVWYLRRKKYISNSGAYFLNVIYATAFALRLSAFSLVFLSRLSNYYSYIIYFILAYLMTKFSKKIPITSQMLVYVIMAYTWLATIILNNGGETYPYHSAILGL